QQAHRLRLVREERGQTAREAKSVGNEVTADEWPTRGRQVTFVENEVQDAENGVEARRERVAIGNLVRDVGARDLRLRASTALSDGRFVYQECARDFRDAETPERTQSQCDLGPAREGEMAAGENQAQLIFGYRRDLELVL